MKFVYELDKKKYKKILNILHFKCNLIYLSLFTIFYFIVNAYAMKFNIPLVLISYLVYALLFSLAVFLINTIYNSLYLKKISKNNIYGEYKFNVNKEEIKEQVNGNIYIIKIKDIKKIKIHKKYLTIKTNNTRVSYFKFILNDNYDKLVKYLDSIN